jgi:hypothetical protein
MLVERAIDADGAVRSQAVSLNTNRSIKAASQKEALNLIWSP